MTGESTATIDTSSGGPVRTAPAPRIDTSSLGTDPTLGVDNDTAKFVRDSREYALKGSNRDALINFTQGLNDSIVAKYAGIRARQQGINATTDARTYALNNSKGLKDSGTGAGAVGAEQEKGKEALDRIDAGQQAELSAAIGKADNLRQNQIRNETALGTKNQADSDKVAAQHKKDATDILTSFAKNGTNGVDLETLKTKEPDVYQSLQKALGYSDLEMTAKYNALKNTPAKLQFKINGDHVTGYGVGPDGKMTVQDEVVPGLSSGKYSIRTLDDGTLVKINQDTNEITTLHQGTKNNPKPTTYTKNQETDAKNWLARQTGFDSNTDYKAFDSDPTFKAWAIQKAADEKGAKKKSTPGAPTKSNPFSQ